MGTILLVLVVVMLAVMLFIAMIEQAGGYLGDSSMVPGCLLISVTVITIVIIAGVVAGRIAIHIH